jgi:S-adenosylmethionine hydrolase
MTTFVSFLSDFGYEDEFVGVVHGVIAKMSPETRVIDVNHSVHPGSVRSGALSLMRAIQYLPEGVALGVVDPGVGTDRLPIAVETDWGYFVGPDNGLLSPAVALVGGARAAYTLVNPDFVIPSAGATFDGRDRFGPAAAVLASGEARIQDLGDAIDPASLKPMILPLPEVTDSTVSGHTWWIDRFGNVQTNIGPADLAEIGIGIGDTMTIKVGLNERVVQLVDTYGRVEEGALMAVVDSQGLVALSVRQGRASDELSIGLERPVTFARS